MHGSRTGDAFGLTVRTRNVFSKRFDCNEIADSMSEIAAGGTAVTVEPDPAGDTSPAPATTP